MVNTAVIIVYLRNFPVAYIDSPNFLGHSFGKHQGISSYHRERVSGKDYFNQDEMFGVKLRSGEFNCLSCFQKEPR